MRAQRDNKLSVQSASALQVLDHQFGQSITVDLRRVHRRSERVEQRLCSEPQLLRCQPVDQSTLNGRALGEAHTDDPARPMSGADSDSSTGAETERT